MNASPPRHLLGKKSQRYKRWDQQSESDTNTSRANSDMCHLTKDTFSANSNCGTTCWNNGT